VVFVEIKYSQLDFFWSHNKEICHTVLQIRYEQCRVKIYVYAKQLSLYLKKHETKKGIDPDAVVVGSNKIEKNSGNDRTYGIILRSLFTQVEKISRTLHPTIHRGPLPMRMTHGSILNLCFRTWDLPTHTQEPIAKMTYDQTLPCTLSEISEWDFLTQNQRSNPWPKECWDPTTTRLKDSNKIEACPNSQ
jgi:hypothetical protein